LFAKVPSYEQRRRAETTKKDKERWSFLLAKKFTFEEKKGVQRKRSSAIAYENTAVASLASLSL